MAAALIAAGREVYVPLFGAHARTDLVVSDGTRLLRVQCKTSRLVGDVVLFATCSNTGNRRHDYDGQVDAFGVYSPGLDQVFLVPSDGLPGRACSLRTRPARNGQTKGLRWARDYVVTPPPPASVRPV